MQATGNAAIDCELTDHGNMCRDWEMRAIACTACVEAARRRLLKEGRRREYYL
jgi:hypothetical protein